MERIGIIGSGRAGTALGAALAAAGYPVVGVTARSQASRERAARLLPGIPILSSAELAGAADVLVVAVPDDAIGAVAAELPTTPDQYVVHLSGAHGLAVLGRTAAVPVALHPPMTFTGTAVDVERIAEVTFTATAPAGARSLVERLVKDLGAGLQWVPDEQRALYHAGVAHGANHLVTLLVQAFDVLRAAGIADPAVTLRPILVATLDNTLRSGHDALTGPIARGDVDTVRAHLEALGEVGGRTLATYVELARATVEMAGADGRLDRPAAERLQAVLAAGAVRGQEAVRGQDAVRGQAVSDRTGEAPR
jgi:predicted short-subunit dehydrogenase-like oxidoreductase (DUF2520 family)